MGNKQLELFKRAEIRLIEATEAEVDAFANDLKAFLDRALADILNKLDTSNESLAIAQLGGILEGLKQAGLKGKIDRVGVIYGRELRRIEEQFRDIDLPATFARADLDTVQALVEFKAQEIESEIVRYFAGIRPILLDSIIAGTRPDLAALRNQLDGATFNKVKTELNTGLATFNRTINKQQADRLDLDLFLYVGPDDDLTRPFCASLLERDPPIYRLDEIPGTNDNGLDSLTSGGGYNCRHHWRGVTEEFARELGWQPG